MRIPFPDKFKTKYIGLGAAALFFGQLVEGTEFYFACLTALYVVLFGFAFNAGKGMQYASGAYIFFNGTLTAILGLTWKVMIGEPGEHNLLSPNKTMLAYCVCMAIMGVCAALSHRLIPKRGLVANIASGPAMMRAALGCLVLGVILKLAFGSQTATTGSLAAALNQANRFPEMAIILGTTYQIQRTNGKSSMNWVVLTAISTLFFFGVIYTSKEGMLIGPVTWILSAIANRYNFNLRYLLGLGLFGFVMIYYLVPYSQYVRQFRDDAGRRQQSQDNVAEYFFNLGKTRQLFLDAQEKENDSYVQAPHLYDEPQGMFDRLEMLAYDDKLLNYTDEGHEFGMFPTWSAYINVVPHFIWKSKPVWGFGNNYGREIGVLATDDNSTGISFSPVGESYHQASWFALIVIWPVVFFLYCFTTDSVVGKVRDSPWPLLPIALVSHIAPEGGVTGPIQQQTTGILLIFMIAWTSRYFLPMVGYLITGGDKTRVVKTVDFRPGVLAGRQAATAPGGAPGGGPILPGGTGI